MRDSNERVAPKRRRRITKVEIQSSIDVAVQGGLGVFVNGNVYDTNYETDLSRAKIEICTPYRFAVTVDNSVAITMPLAENKKELTKGELLSYVRGLVSSHSVAVDTEEKYLLDASERLIKHALSTLGNVRVVDTDSCEFIVEGYSLHVKSCGNGLFAYKQDGSDEVRSVTEGNLIRKMNSLYREKALRTGVYYVSPGRVINDNKELQ